MINTNEDEVFENEGGLILESEFVEPDELDEIDEPNEEETMPWLTEDEPYDLLEERLMHLENRLQLLEERIEKTFKHAGFKF